LVVYVSTIELGRYIVYLIVFEEHFKMIILYPKKLKVIYLIKAYCAYNICLIISQKSDLIWRWVVIICMISARLDEFYSLIGLKIVPLSLIINVFPNPKY
jgi:hypothetical protein